MRWPASSHSMAHRFLAEIAERLADGFHERLQSIGRTFQKQLLDMGALDEAIAFAPHHTPSFDLDAGQAEFFRSVFRARRELVDNLTEVKKCGESDRIGKHVLEIEPARDWLLD